jgi:thiol-disulfide isomerase/thioredoxin
MLGLGKNTSKLIMVGIFLVGVVLIYLWSRVNRKMEGFADSAYKMVMYGVDWCPHCVRAKPEFEALGSTMTIGGKEVSLEVVDPEKEPAKAAGKKIAGYPTIQLQDGNGVLVKEYSGPRETSEFRKFLEENVV